MKKITILALHLGYGGIEKCICNLANSLIDDYKIEIISTYKLYEKPAFVLDERVEVKYLMTDLKPNRKEIKEAMKKKKFITFFKELIRANRILKLKKDLMIDAIKNCDSDIIISTRDIHNLWLGMYGKEEALKIGWEHSHHNNNKKYIDKVVKSASNLNYFILVSKELSEFYEEKLHHTSCHVLNIPNYLDYYPRVTSTLKSNHMVSVGRLSKEKGYSDLIDVFKLVHEKHPDYVLNIIGDGSEKSSIEKKISNYGLEESIIMHGFQNKDYINKIFEESSVYVMTSLTEAFPMVLLEASSFGLPAVVFTSAQGANEIIKDNWDGYLIENRDKEKMAKRICELMTNYNRRFIMGQNAIKKAKNYSQDKIKNEWIKIIEKG